MLFTNTQAASLYQPLIESIEQQGFVHFSPAAFETLCGFTAKKTPIAGEGWQDLVQDTYMADNGQYRYRRYATLALNVGQDTAQRLPNEPHFQSVHYNPLNGGIERHFAPIHDSTLQSPAILGILEGSRQLLRQLEPTTEQWRVEMHQFRIVTAKDFTGQPTPEGIHQDGVVYVLITLIDRQNIVGGVSRIYDKDKAMLYETTLLAPYESLFLKDTAVFHSVTPIVPAQDAAMGHRDVLVLTFKYPYHSSKGSHQ